MVKFIKIFDPAILHLGINPIDTLIRSGMEGEAMFKDMHYDENEINNSLHNHINRNKMLTNIFNKSIRFINLKL